MRVQSVRLYVLVSVVVTKNELKMPKIKTIIRENSLNSYQKLRSYISSSQKEMSADEVSTKCYL